MQTVANTLLPLVGNFLCPFQWGQGSRAPQQLLISEMAAALFRCGIQPPRSRHRIFFIVQLFCSVPTLSTRIQEGHKRTFFFLSPPVKFFINNIQKRSQTHYYPCPRIFSTSSASGHSIFRGGVCAAARVSTWKADVRVEGWGRQTGGRRRTRADKRARGQQRETKLRLFAHFYRAAPPKIRVIDRVYRYLTAYIAADD